MTKRKWMTEKINCVKIWVWTYMFLGKKMTSNVPIYIFLLYIRIKNLYMCTTYSNKRSKMITTVFVLSVKKLLITVFLVSSVKKPLIIIFVSSIKKPLIIVFECVFKSHVSSMNFHLCDLFSKTLFTNWNHQTLRNFLNVS